MEEAEYPTAADYRHFNAFFTRALQPGARPVDNGEDTLVSPVDGVISQAGTITGKTLVQAKGYDYTLNELLAGDIQLASTFSDGSYSTIYLSPRDYHRIHMPCAGHLQRMIHVPGRRFAVNATSAAGIERLFARNERLVNLFDTAAGPMALIMVGALFVGSMETTWTDPLPARGGGEITNHDYSGLNTRLSRGMEMGRFNMGSTVILLFSRNRADWLPGLQPGTRVHMGEAIATVNNG